MRLYLADTLSSGGIVTYNKSSATMVSGSGSPSFYMVFQHIAWGNGYRVIIYGRTGFLSSDILMFQRARQR